MDIFEINENIYECVNNAIKTTNREGFQYYEKRLDYLLQLRRNFLYYM
jgi:hypothetical protein